MLLGMTWGETAMVVVIFVLIYGAGLVARFVRTPPRDPTS